MDSNRRERLKQGRNRKGRLAQGSNRSERLEWKAIGEKGKYRAAIAEKV